MKSHQILRPKDYAGCMHQEAGFLDLRIWSTTVPIAWVPPIMCFSCLYCMPGGTSAALLSAFICGQRSWASTVVVIDFSLGSLLRRVWAEVSGQRVSAFSLSVLGVSWGMAARKKAESRLDPPVLLHPQSSEFSRLIEVRVPGDILP